MSDNAASTADPFGQIADEFVEAFRRGKSPSVEEFARRYPAHADEIRDMLPALALMEQAKSSGDASVEQPKPASSAVPRLRQLGDYQILREVGRGGMGVVYEAQQLSLGRHVAIKVLPNHALLDPRQLGRFQREARSAARLHHTNIVPVFGVGEQGGLHYYVMQFIQGLGLDVVLSELRRLRQPRGKLAPTQEDVPGHQIHGTQAVSAADVACALISGGFRQPEPTAGLTIALAEPGVDGGPEAPAAAPTADTSATIHLPGQSETASLTESGRQYWVSVARVGVQVAEALAYAAGQGVLHRDIKPSNLLLDDTGNVWVTDFGLAKAQSDDDLTHTGDIVGTLRYLAPERFNGQGDLRGDVYSLGLTLYELLTLRPAFDEADRNKLVRQVMHDEPQRPRKLNPAVPRDLETVVLKAIARDPAHRYQSPAALADDLRRFVEDRPVKARRVSETEKFLRWCRRNPLPASLLAGIVLVFLAGFAGVSWQWREAAAARDDEKHQRGRAEVLRKGAETARDEAVAARDDANQTRNAAARQAAGLLLDRGIEEACRGELAWALHLFVQALVALPADDPDADSLERVIRTNLSAWAETVPALEHIWPGLSKYSGLAFSPDGALVALPTRATEIQVFRTNDGQPAGPPVTLADGVGRLVFAPDGRSLWVGPPDNFNPDATAWALRRVEVASGRDVQPPIPTPGPIYRLVPTPDGRHLVGAVLGLHPEERGPASNADRTRWWRTASITVWETASGQVVRRVAVNAGGYRSFLGLSPDGRSVTAWVEPEGNSFAGLTFSVAGTEAPKHLGTLPLKIDLYGNFHFDDQLRTALAVRDGQVHRWADTAPGALGPGVPSPFRYLQGAAPDGRSAVSRGEGRVFDTGAWPPRPSGVRFAHPGWHLIAYSHADPSPDGGWLATSIFDGSQTRLWRLPRPHSRPPLPEAERAQEPPGPASFSRAAVDPAGARAVLYDSLNGVLNRQVRVVDLARGGVCRPPADHAARVRNVAVTRDGRHFATASEDGTAQVWEAATGRPAGPVLRHMNYVAAVAFSPDGNTLAAGDYGPAWLVKLWDWRTGKETRPPLRHDDIILGVAFSPDGRHLAALKTGDWSKKPEVWLWEVATGAATARIPLGSFGGHVTFRPAGRAVLCRNATGVLRLWEVPSGRVLGERALDGQGVDCWSPDGKTVAASEARGVRLLDGDTLAPLSAGLLPHAPDPVQDLAFSPDGAWLLTGHQSGSAQLWDVASRKPVGPPAVLIGPIRGVTFTADGKTCVCVAADGAVRRWPVPAPLAEPDLARLADRVTLMTGQRMDEAQGLDYVPAGEWRDLRARLVGDGSTALVPPRPDADWHDARAADAQQDRDALGADWHLGRLAKLRPDDWTVPARLGRILAAAGRKDEAAAAYDKAARLARPPRDLADWLRAAAADDEVAGRYDRGLWNLDRAVKLTPGDWAPYAARAALAEQAGQAERADDVDAAVRLGAEATVIVQAAERAVGRAKAPADWARLAGLLKAADKDSTLPIEDRYHLAVACRKAGDLQGYRAACAGIAGWMPPAGEPVLLADALAAAKAFALGPGSADDWAIPLSWIDQTETRIAKREVADPSLKERNKPWRQLFLHLRGALLVRAGRPGEAAAVLREPAALHRLDSEFSNWVYLALAKHRLGHADAAKEAAAKARAARPALKDNQVWERAEVELLAAELEAAFPAGK